MDTVQTRILLENEDLINQFDVVVNTGLAGSAFQGDCYWKNERLLTIIRKFVASGKGFIGIGDPTGYEFNGKYFQLADVLGVQKERGFTYSRTKFFPIKNEKHWIVEDLDLRNIKFGSQGTSVYPIGADVILSSDSEFNPTTCLLTGGSVYLSAHAFGLGRAVYISSLADSYDAFRMVYKAILWACGREDLYHKALSTNVNTDCYYYEGKNSYAIINNVGETVKTVFYDIDGKSEELELSPNEIRWL